MDISLKKPLVYVARDIERALGREPGGRYFITSNDTTYGREVRKKHPKNVLLIPNEGEPFDTYDLLMLPKVQAEIAELGADVLVFQNTSRIERLAREKGWNLLNPPAELSKKIEEKISQTTWLGDDARLLPPHKIMILREVAFTGTKFVLQFNHAHTGQGTCIIEKAETLEELQSRFPDRECRVSDFIDGPVFTVNVVVGKGIIIGNPSYQITGLTPFTDLPFSTIGNDWALPQKKEFEKAYEDITAMAKTIGERIQKSGWKGLFGIDVIYDGKKTYLLEINARQPASTTFESQLQGSPSIFEAHIAALLGQDFESKLPSVSGAQILKRMTEIQQTIEIEKLEAKKLSVISYENVAPNSELFRIQSTEGIMKGHNELDGLGIFIQSCIK